MRQIAEFLVGTVCATTAAALEFALTRTVADFDGPTRFQRRAIEIWHQLRLVAEARAVTP